MPGNVVIYGTVCLDRFIREGQTDATMIEFPGGEGFNTATALAGYGVPVTLVGTATGSDAEGIRLRELLHTHPLAQDIYSDLVPAIPEAVTPVCQVTVDAQGERFFQGRGFREAVPPPLEPLLPLFASRPLFTVDPNLRQAAVDAALAAAAASCKVVSMDLSSTPEVLAVSHVAVTSHEWITRRENFVDDETEVRRMADAGAKIAIVTQGMYGGVVCERDSGKLSRYSAITPPAPIIDTTGAGDTFRAGLCYGVLHQLDMVAMLRFAAAAAALHCTVMGGGSRFSLAEVETLALSAL